MYASFHTDLREELLRFTTSGFDLKRFGSMEAKQPMAIVWTPLLALMKASYHIAGNIGRN